MMQTKKYHFSSIAIGAIAAVLLSATTAAMTAYAIAAADPTPEDAESLSIEPNTLFAPSYPADGTTPTITIPSKASPTFSSINVRDILVNDGPDDTLAEDSPLQIFDFSVFHGIIDARKGFKNTGVQLPEPGDSGELANALRPAKVGAALSSTTPASDVILASRPTIIARFILTAEGNAALLNQIGINFSGTVTAPDITVIRLLHASTGEPIATLTQFDRNKTALFTVNSANSRIALGGSMEIDVEVTIAQTAQSGRVISAMLDPTLLTLSNGEALDFHYPVGNRFTIVHNNKLFVSTTGSPVSKLQVLEGNFQEYSRVELTTEFNSADFARIESAEIQLERITPSHTDALRGASGEDLCAAGEGLTPDDIEYVRLYDVESGLTKGVGYFDAATWKATVDTSYMPFEVLKDAVRHLGVAAKIRVDDIADQNECFRLNIVSLKIAGERITIHGLPENGIGKTHKLIDQIKRVRPSLSVTPPNNARVVVRGTTQQIVGFDFKAEYGDILLQGLRLRQYSSVILNSGDLMNLRLVNPNPGTDQPASYPAVWDGTTAVLTNLNLNIPDGTTTTLILEGEISVTAPVGALFHYGIRWPTAGDITIADGGILTLESSIQGADIQITSLNNLIAVPSTTDPASNEWLLEGLTDTPVFSATLSADFNTDASLGPIVDEVNFSTIAVGFKPVSDLPNCADTRIAREDFAQTPSSVALYHAGSRITSTSFNEFGLAYLYIPNNVLPPLSNGETMTLGVRANIAADSTADPYECFKITLEVAQASEQLGDNPIDLRTVNFPLAGNSHRIIENAAEIPNESMSQVSYDFTSDAGIIYRDQVSEIARYTFSTTGPAIINSLTYHVSNNVEYVVLQDESGQYLGTAAYPDANGVVTFSGLNKNIQAGAPLTVIALAKVPYNAPLGSTLVITMEAADIGLTLGQIVDSGIPMTSAPKQIQSNSTLTASFNGAGGTVPSNLSVPEGTEGFLAAKLTLASSLDAGETVRVDSLQLRLDSITEAGGGPAGCTALTPADISRVKVYDQNDQNDQTGFLVQENDFSATGNEAWINFADDPGGSLMMGENTTKTYDVRVDITREATLVDHNECFAISMPSIRAVNGPNDLAVMGLNTQSAPHFVADVQPPPPPSNGLYVEVAPTNPVNTIAYRGNVPRGFARIKLTSVGQAMTLTGLTMRFDPTFMRQVGWIKPIDMNTGADLANMVFSSSYAADGTVNFTTNLYIAPNATKTIEFTGYINRTAPTGTVIAWTLENSTSNFRFSSGNAADIIQSLVEVRGTTVVASQNTFNITSSPGQESTTNFDEINATKLMNVLTPDVKLPDGESVAIERISVALEQRTDIAGCAVPQAGEGVIAGQDIVQNASIGFGANSYSAPFDGAGIASVLLNPPVVLTDNANTSLYVFTDVLSDNLFGEADECFGFNVVDTTITKTSPETTVLWTAANTRGGTHKIVNLAYTAPVVTIEAVNGNDNFHERFTEQEGERTVATYRYSSNVDNIIMRYPSFMITPITGTDLPVDNDGTPGGSTTNYTCSGSISVEDIQSIRLLDQAGAEIKFDGTDGSFYDGRGAIMGDASVADIVFAANETKEYEVLVDFIDDSVADPRECFSVEFMPSFYYTTGSGSQLTVTGNVITNTARTQIVVEQGASPTGMLRNTDNEHYFASTLSLLAPIAKATPLSNIGGFFPANAELRNPVQIFNNLQVISNGVEPGNVSVKGYVTNTSASLGVQVDDDLTVYGELTAERIGCYRLQEVMSRRGTGATPSLVEVSTGCGDTGIVVGCSARLRGSDPSPANGTFHGTELPYIYTCKASAHMDNLTYMEMQVMCFYPDEQC